MPVHLYIVSISSERNRRGEATDACADDGDGERLRRIVVVVAYLSTCSMVARLAKFPSCTALVAVRQVVLDYHALSLDVDFNRREIMNKDAITNSIPAIARFSMLVIAITWDRSAFSEMSGIPNTQDGGDTSRDESAVLTPFIGSARALLMSPHSWAYAVG